MYLERHIVMEMNEFVAGMEEKINQVRGYVAVAWLRHAIYYFLYFIIPSFDYATFLHPLSWRS